MAFSEDRGLILQSVENYWLQCIKNWYPQLQTQTFFLPPIHFNRVPYSKKYIADQQVLVARIPQDTPSQTSPPDESRSRKFERKRKFTSPQLLDSDAREDRAQERVLCCLRALADSSHPKEVMMVLSQLQFGNYLGEPCYAAVGALLPRPRTLPEHFLQQHYDEGDFDVLIIHRQHGLFTFEIKSVGTHLCEMNYTEDQEDDIVRKRVKQAVEQLIKSEVVLKHLTSDLTPDIKVTKVLVMPNIQSTQLLRAVSKDNIDQLLCQCLGVLSVDDAAKLCLLSEQLSDQHISSDVNQSSLRGLREWWQHLVSLTRTDPLMTSSSYEQLVARFCGPATTVEVHCVTVPRLNIRTLGEAVSETGGRVARIVLLPQQVDILNRSPPRAFYIGPPGTGKTVVLIMQGVTWLQRGHDVHVVSTWDKSLAATIVIEHQIRETAKMSTAKSRVHRHHFDLRKDGEVENAVRRLKSLSEGRQLCVIADEAVRFSDTFGEFCNRLIAHVPGVYIWGASAYHDIRPLCMEEVKLTTPLRSPPVVVREVMESKQIKEYKRVHDYTVSDVPVPTDGPPIMRIKHNDCQPGHLADWPLDCIQCGHEIARVLTELDVGRTGDSNGPPSLQFRDVLVLCDDYLTDDRINGSGQMITTASGLVRGLRDRHVPVRVVEKGDEAAIRDTALGVGDLVTVAFWEDVRGLERKVVVVESGIDCYRLHSMSRCTSQLVIVD